MIEPIFEIKSERQTPNFGVFIIEPLQQGYGQTLGNALRRILLSSLPGVAVTQIKISGVRHQFATINGLREDVVELILNIKKIRIEYSADKPTKMVLDKTGPGQIKASDIEAPTGVRIVNKDLVLGTLADKKSRLKVEMVVERGYGFSLAEERPTDEIGVIPTDAVFSPVCRVNYQVSATRVGGMINWDRLTLEIWTDGTVSPQDALVQTTKTLIPFFQRIVSPKEGKKAVSQKKKKIPEETLQMSVEELELPTRIANALTKGGLATVSDIIKARKKKIVKVKNLGIKSIKLIQAAFRQKGLVLPE